MQVIDIIREITAAKRALKVDPCHALLIKEIFPRYTEIPGTQSLVAQLHDLVEWGFITEHRTSQDTAYLVVEPQTQQIQQDEP